MQELLGIPEVDSCSVVQDMHELSGIPELPEKAYTQFA
jgi:hypothetical protein